MQWKDASISEILQKYAQDEKVIEQRLHECEKRRFEIKSRANNTFEHYDFLTNNVSIERDTSLLRNQRLLKDLEKAKARLRTLATFTPTDQELYDLANFYRSGLK